MNKKAFLFLLPVAAMAVVGCSKKGGGSGGDTGVKVTSIDVSAYDIAVEVEDTIKLNALVAPENATNKAIDWSVDSAKAVIDDDGNITGVTEGDIVVTAAAKDGSGIKKTFNFKVMPKSTLKDVCVAAAALDNMAKSSETMTFTGTVSAISKNCFYLQDSRHGFYVYNTATIADLAVGKLATVTSKITKYNGLLETSGTPTVVIGEDGTAPEVLGISSVEQLKGVNQSILCDFTGIMPNDLPVWGTGKSIMPTLTIGGEEAIVKFDGNGQTADQMAVYADAECKTINFKKGLTTVYDTAGLMACNQLVTSGATVLEVPEIAVTGLEIQPIADFLSIESKKVIYNVSPVGATTPVTIEVVTGDDVVEVSGKTLVAKKGGTYSVRAVAGSVVSPTVQGTVVAVDKVAGFSALSKYTVSDESASNGYIDPYVITQDTIQWDVKAMNCSKASWDHLRFGRKSNDSVATFASKQIADSVDMIQMNFVQINTKMVNSSYFEVSKNDDFSSPVVIPMTIALGKVIVEVPEEDRGTGLYYRFVCDMKSDGSANGANRFNEFSLLAIAK